MGKFLSDEHRDKLHNETGLKDPMIAAAGLYTAGEECTDLVRIKPEGGARWGPSLVFPFLGYNGELLDYCQIRPDSPRHNKDGDPIKYESPRNEEPRAYFAPGAAALMKSTRQVIFTEGAKKALKATQEGFACISLAGVWNGFQKRLTTSGGKKYGKRKLLPDIAAIDWKGMQVIIGFDSDAAEKRSVRLAEVQFAAAMIEQGATVRILRLPKLGDGKTGIDDFLVHYGENGAAELQKLIDAAKEPEPLPELSKLDIARLLIEEFYTKPSGCLLRWQRDEFFAYDHNRYRNFPASELLMMVIQQLDAIGFDSSPRTAAEIVKCMASECRIECIIDPPVFIPRPQLDTSLWVSTAGGVLDLQQLLDGKPPILRPHSPEWFSLNCLPFHYVPGADCPKFRAFLDEVMEGDEDRIDILKEWTGYNLVPDISQHKFLICEGEGANGKSVYLKILRALIGSDNCSHVPLESFGQRFQLWPTVGKLANIIGEVGDLAKPDEAIFKSYVGGDTIQIDRKSLPILNVTPTARITIATNTRPRWVDRSEGIWRRMLLVPFRIQIPDKRQDKGLASYIIENELPGVFNWAVSGLMALRKRGYFTEATICDEAIKDYRNEVNPAKTFLQDECEEDPSSTIQTRWLYAAYAQWCKESGYYPLGDRHFGLEVRRSYPMVQRDQATVTEIDNTRRRVWCIRGIKSEAAERAKNAAQEKRERELMVFSRAG